MRILFWSETFWPRVGGVENLAARLLPALQARGYEFTVVTWENVEHSDVIRFMNTPVYRLPFFSNETAGGLEPLMRMRAQVGRIKRDFAPDLIHINSYGLSVLFHLNTAKAHAAPTLLTLHQALPSNPAQSDTLLAHTLGSVDWLTACSASVLASARDAMPEISDRSSLIYNGIEASAQVLQPISFDPPRLLCVGRLVHEKGFDLALAAFARIRARFPTASLVIAGDGGEAENLRRHASDLAVSTAVRFTGLVTPDTITKHINDATVVLVPSRLEGFGLVPLEAALMARPVVATRVGGLPEIIVHGETGLLSAAEDPQALAESIEFLLSHPEHAERMGQAARTRAGKEFGWTRYVDAYDSLYRRLTARARPDTSGKPLGGTSPAH
jgi:glycogen(starch) synthase